MHTPFEDSFTCQDACPGNCPLFSTVFGGRSRMALAAAAGARQSLESEPDLVAYDSSSLHYSYGPPAIGSASGSAMSSAAPSPELGKHNTPLAAAAAAADTVTDYGNRSRARAYSLATRTSLPLYTSNGAGDSGPRPTGTSGDRFDYRAGHEQADDDEEEDDDDDDDVDLEMDTLNKNSGGRGGWKMVHLQDQDGELPSPISPDSPYGSKSGVSGGGGVRRSTSLNMTQIMAERRLQQQQQRREAAAGNGIGGGGHGSPGGGKAASKKPAYSRFERFNAAEWTAMSVSLVLVSILTVVSLDVCFR